MSEWGLAEIVSATAPLGQMLRRATHAGHRGCHAARLRVVVVGVEA